jgi:hypothetical protein
MCPPSLVIPPHDLTNLQRPYVRRPFKHESYHMRESLYVSMLSHTTILGLHDANIFSSTDYYSCIE